MARVTLTLPDEIAPEDAQLYLALKLYETGKGSLGQASEISGYSVRAFVEILDKHNVPLFNQDPDDLR